MIRASAPGKLILIGEYAVLEGAPALVSAVDRLAQVTLQQKQTGNYSVSAASIDIGNAEFSIGDNNLLYFADNLDFETQKKLTFFKSTFEYAWQYCSRYKISKAPFHMRIDTDAFYSRELSTKLGFGSSAALTVAMVKALFLFINKDLTDNRTLNKLFRLSLAAHTKAQGNMGSGIDVAASAYGGVLQYRVGMNNKAEHLLPEKIEPWPELPMLVVFTGSSESTRKMVFGVNELKKKRPAVFQELMRELEATSREGCKAYKSKNLYAFLNAVKTFHVQMNLLGKNSGMPIISAVHQQIARTIHQSGGAYKPSGAGSGDIGIAFAESMDKLETIRKHIEQQNFHCIDTHIAY